MVKPTLLSIAILSALSGMVVADNCKHGLYYCGYVLLRRGNYYNDIVSSLQAAGQPTDSNHVENSLFYCEGDDNVPWVSTCGTCVDGGSGHSDHC